MADFDSSLPVRTEAAGDVDVNISDAVTPSQKLVVNADGSINTVTTATDLDIRDLTAASDSVSAHLKDDTGAAYSLTNPLPVEMVSDSSGDEVCDYNTTASVAKNATTDHDYTVTAGKTFIGEEAFISASGKIKVELLINGVTKFVGFNSTANPNIRIPLDRMPKANAAEVIRMTITNRDSAQDVYSTLTGLEV